MARPGPRGARKLAHESSHKDHLLPDHKAAKATKKSSEAKGDEKDAGELTPEDLEKMKKAAAKSEAAPKKEAKDDKKGKGDKKQGKHQNQTGEDSTNEEQGKSPEEAAKARQREGTKAAAEAGRSEKARAVANARRNEQKHT